MLALQVHVVSYSRRPKGIDVTQEETFLLTKLAGTCEHADDMLVSNTIWTFKDDNGVTMHGCGSGKSHDGFACTICSVAWCNVCGAIFNGPNTYRGPA